MVVASDFTGLIEFSVALIVWVIGVICAITAIILTCKRSPTKGRGDPPAFLAIICSVVIVLVLTPVWAHYRGVDFIPLGFALLPGMAGVGCLIWSRPRNR